MADPTDQKKGCETDAPMDTWTDIYSDDRTVGARASGWVSLTAVDLARRWDERQAGPTGDQTAAETDCETVATAAAAMAVSTAAVMVETQADRKVLMSGIDSAWKQVA